MGNSWKTALKGEPIPWLLDSNAWTRYRTLTDLLELPSDSPKVCKAGAELRADAKVKNHIASASQWYPDRYTRHNDPKISHYQLRMLIDFGLTVEDKEIEAIVKQAVAHRENGLFAMKQELPTTGKAQPSSSSAEEEYHALPCDSPFITYTLLYAGARTPDVTHSVKLIKEHWDSCQGWFCHFPFVNSMFKKVQMGCPMAGLMALEVFSLFPELKESIYARNAYEPIRFHREYGKTLYYFGRSKKFWTLKYPYVWYNALYMADVLTRFEFLRDEELLKELIVWIENSQDGEGRFTPTSMFRMYKGWDFANKKTPSPWITYLCCSILKRYYSTS